MFSSCSHYIKTSYCNVNKDTIITKYDFPNIVFEGKYNRNVKIFIDDSLYFNARIVNDNYKVLIHAKTITLNRFPKTIILKVGLRPKKHIIWNGQYKYIVISEKSKFLPLKCNMMTISRGYK